MSTHEQRLASLNSTRAALAERISALGIRVHDQARVDQWMEDMRRGIMPDMWRITRFLLGGKPALDWEVFDFDEFNDRRDINREYGGAPPHSVVNEADRIRSAMSHARLQVYATKIDPVLAVSEGSTTVFVRGWIQHRIVF